jgi:hypothetical protein
MNAVAQDPIPSPRTVRPEVPAPVERLIEAMVSLDRESRYRSAADLYSDLCNFRYRGRRIQGAAKGRAFVAMPFQRNFNPVWSQIEEACIDTRLRPTRVDRLVQVENIWAQIAQEIAACAVLIADFSATWYSRAPNPNVITEAAYAVALRKPLIVLLQGRPESLPFDWRHVPVVRYQNTSSGLRELAELLRVRLREITGDGR